MLSSTKTARAVATLALIGGVATAGGLGGLTAPPAGAAPPGIEQKRAEAARILDQVHALDLQVERAAESYNLATIRLGEIESNVRANARRVTIARSNLARAQRLLSEQLVSLYTSDAAKMEIEILLGAENLSDAIDRLDAQERISNQDRVLLGQVKTFRTAVLRTQAELKNAKARQQIVVRRRTAERRSIESRLQERKRLRAGIRSEVARLEARERERQARLRRLLQQRLDAQRRETARKAAAREAARQAATAKGVAPPPEEPEPESLLGVGANTPDGPAALPPARFGSVVEIATRYLGIPYVWGGASPSGFDCSGFVLYVYAQLGVSLPHYAASQYGYGSPVPKEALEPGDLVFFDNLGHNGIYVGGGQFIHAPHTGDVVKISSLYDAWYAGHWTGARRL